MMTLPVTLAWAPDRPDVKIKTMG